MTREELAGQLAEAGRALLQPSPGLEKEHVRLFLSPVGALCPPWQSVYEPDEGETPRNLGAAHHSALQWYRKHGMEPAAETEPADHAGLLLVFYAGLLDSGAPDEEIEEFRQRHLAWLPGFLAQVQAETHATEYRELAESVIRLLDERV